MVPELNRCLPYREILSFRPKVLGHGNKPKAEILDPAELKSWIWLRGFWDLNRTLEPADVGRDSQFFKSWVLDFITRMHL